jgi:seryl-tRNA synthetase
VIDLKLLRDDPDVVRRSQLSRGEDPALVDVLLAADTARRAAISTADTLRAEQKAASKKVGSAAPDQRPACWRRPKSLPHRSRAPKARRPRRRPR